MDAHARNPDGTALLINDSALTPTIAVLKRARTAPRAAGPRCGRLSDPVHSRDLRTGADRPAHDRPGAPRLIVRRFRHATPRHATPRPTARSPASASAGPIGARPTPARPIGSPTLTDAHRLVGLASGGEAGARPAGHRSDAIEQQSSVLARIRGGR